MDATCGKMVEFEPDSLVKKRHDRRVTDEGERLEEPRGAVEGGVGC